MQLFAKLSYFLNRKSKLQAAGLFSLMLLGAIFEAIGVALVFPLIALVSDPTILERSGVLRRFYEFSGLTAFNDFLLLMVGVLLLMYVVKHVYLALLFYTQYKFVFDQQVGLTKRLLNVYLRSPYTFHLQRNSAELLRNVNFDILAVFVNVVIPIFQVLIEVLVVVAILTVLLVTSPVPTVCAIIVLGGASVGFYSLIRRRTTALGKIQQYHLGEMNKWVNQGLGGIKETKILGREEFFLEAYGAGSAGYARSMRYLRTMSEVPRLLIEFLVVGGLLFIIALMLWMKQDVRTLMPVIGLFAMAAIRLMPSLNRILTGLASIRYFVPSVEVVYQDLKQLEDIAAEDEKAVLKSNRAPIDFQKNIVIEGIGFSYPNARKAALNKISLTIAKGESVAFVGSSGAGKTTAVDVILGLLTPTEGRILVDGVDIQTNLAAWQRKIGYIPQPVYLSDDSIRRNVAFGIGNDEIADETVWTALKAAQLEDFVRSLPEGLETEIGENGVCLSGGQRQRIGIARALYHNPEVLVLDEATAALDNETETEVTKAIELLGRTKTVIAIAHRLTTIKNVDCIFFMKNGEIVAADSYDNLLENNKDFQKMAKPLASDTKAAALSWQ